MAITRPDPLPKFILINKPIEFAWSETGYHDIYFYQGSRPKWPLSNTGSPFTVTPDALGKWTLNIAGVSNGTQVFECVKELPSDDPILTVKETDLPVNGKLTLSGVSLVVGQQLKEGDELSLTPSAGYQVASAVIGKDSGESLPFVVASDKKSATVKLTKPSDGVWERIVTSMEVIPPSPVYTLKAVDIIANSKWKVGDTVLKEGDVLYTGNVLRFYADDGYTVNSASIMNNMGSRTEFSVSSDKTYAEWVVAAPSMGSWNRMFGTVRAIPTPYKWTQTDQTSFSSNNIDITINGEKSVVGMLVPDNSAFVATARRGWKIISVFGIAIVGGSEKTVNFAVSGDGSTATGNFITGATNSTQFNWKVVSEKTTEEATGNFNRVYTISDKEMIKLNQERFVVLSAGEETITMDYGKYILSLMAFPFAVPPEMVGDTEAVVLGDRVFTATASKVSDSKILLDLGEIVVKRKFNDSRDYEGVEAVLILPYCENIALDIAKVYDAPLKVSYEVDCYSGRVNVQVTRDGVPVVSKMVNMGFDVPYIDTMNMTVENNSIEFHGENGYRTPTVALYVKDAPDAESMFNVPVVETGVLGGYTGYVEVNKIQLTGKLTQSERLLLNQQMNEGIIINETTER